MSRSKAAAQTEAAVRSQRAVNKMFERHAAQAQRQRDSRINGRTWDSSCVETLHSRLEAMTNPNGRLTPPPGSYINNSSAADKKNEGAAGEAAVAAAADTEGQRPSAHNSSCFVINSKRAKHRYERPEDAFRKLQNERYSYAEHLKEYNKARAIVRHERTIPKRRIVDRYISLTDAQTDLAMVVPSRFSVRRRVREHEGWVLDNVERQQLVKGKPLMTRVVEGEYYYSEHPRRTTQNYIQMNKGHVRAASAVSRVCNAHAGTEELPSEHRSPIPQRTVATLRQLHTMPHGKEATVQQRRAHSAAARVAARIIAPVTHCTVNHTECRHTMPLGASGTFAYMDTPVV